MFLGIAIGSIYQYVIGIRKLDVRDKGFAFDYRICYSTCNMSVSITTSILL